MRTSVLAAFQTYLTSKIAKTFARCWKVTLDDGVVMGFTTHTRNLVFEGITYEMLTGLTTSSIKSSEGLSVDNLAIAAFLSSKDERDIVKGRFDGAMLEIFVVNYFNLSMGKLREKTGFLGEVTRADGVFQAELRGLMDRLRTKIGRAHTAACDARLGDIRCKVALGQYTATITSVTGAKSFQAAALAGFPTDFFTDGDVRFVNGDNIGVVRDIRLQSDINFSFFLTTPFPLVVGDALLLHIGCNKSKRTCIDKFANVINFRGFDFVPVIEQVFDSPINLIPNPTICVPADAMISDGSSGSGGGEFVPPPSDTTDGQAG